MRVPGRLPEFWDRVVASDPGLTRLRTATAAAIAMASALCVEYLYATLTGATVTGVTIAMLLGAMVAMMGSMALSGATPWRKVLTALFFPVALGSGMLVGVAVGGRTDLMLAVFVAVMFVAVFVRRFGPAFFSYGFMIWMGYFFAAFLHATVATLPSLISAVSVGSAWVLLLSLTVLRGHPSQTLRRVVRAFDAQARAVARAGADLLETEPDETAKARRARRRLRAHLARLAEVALMAEAWSAERGAVPRNWSAPVLRRRLLDDQQTVDDLACAADALADGDRALAVLAVPVLEGLARRDDASAHRAAVALAAAADQPASARADTGHGPEAGHRAEAASWPAARRLASAAQEFTAPARLATDPPDDDDFSPAVTLAMGNLPGAPAVAREVTPRGSGWNPLVRLQMTTRQAIQVAIAGALAIVAGRELSTTRYYWAVIAAFIMFAGTGTRAETFIKGFNRVAGTLFGLFASIWVANLTAGHTMLVLVAIVASMFFGFYLVRVSYAYMIFFITIMVGQLYSVLHEFSEGLLVLRLEETAIGAAAGFAVALIVLPISTRDTVRSARDALLTDIADLLDAAALRLRGEPLANDEVDEADVAEVADLDQLARALDDRMRQLNLVARPLTRTLVWGNSPPRMRRRLVLYAAAASHARGLVVQLRLWPTVAPGAAEASQALARAIRILTETAPGERQPAVVEPLAEAESALLREPDANAPEGVVRALTHLCRVVLEIGEPGRHGQPAPAAPLAPAPGPPKVRHPELPRTADAA